MEKTRIGISVVLMSIFVYIAAWLGGFVPVILLAGYILLMEESVELKKAAVRALTFMITITLLMAGLGFIKDIESFVVQILPFLGFIGGIINRICNYAIDIIDLVEQLVYLLLIFTASAGMKFEIPFVDGLVEKHMN